MTRLPNPRLIAKATTIFLIMVFALVPAWRCARTGKRIRALPSQVGRVQGARRIRADVALLTKRRCIATAVVGDGKDLLIRGEVGSSWMLVALDEEDGSPSESFGVEGEGTSETGPGYDAVGAVVADGEFVYACT